MKNTYFCKCGRIVHKSTDADNTGNRDVQGCTGCPYLLPWGEQAYSKEEGWHLKVKGYECRVSKSLEYVTFFSGCVNDYNVCSVFSLDYEFLEQISNWIQETYPDGELSGGFSREHIRPTDFVSEGRYRFAITCAHNKKGLAAKCKFREHFFDPANQRKDLSPCEEERKIKDLIENGKRAAQRSAPEAVAAAPETKPDILAAENQIFVDPDGLKFRIGTTKVGERRQWRTEYMMKNEWIPANSRSYPEIESEQKEFAAWICAKLLVPMEPENEDPTTPAALPVPPAAAEAGDTTEALATVPEALPAFDYSGMDAEARDTLHVAETMIKSARQKFISDVADAVALAHDALCGVVRQSDNSKHGNRGENSFFAWCASVGLSRSTAYQLLQVSTLFKGSTPVERQTLEQAPAKLLYAAAKPSAPAEAVAAVKSGDITTYKEYQEMAAKLKAAEERAMDIGRDMDKLISENDEILDKLHKTRAQLEASEKQVRDAKNAKEITQQNLDQAISERDSARNMLKNTQKRAERMEIDHSATVSLLRAAQSELAELQSRPIEVAVAEPDPAEIERLATEKAEGIAAQRTAELKAQVDKLQQEAQESRVQDAEDLKMQDYDTVLFAISVIQNAWKSAGPSFRRLNDQCRAQLRRNLLERFAEIETEVRG